MANPSPSQLSAETIAVPAQLHSAVAGGPAAPREMRWYLPGIGETMRLMGWRIIYFVPAAIFLVLGFLVLFNWWLIQIFFFWWKLVIIAVALPVGVATRTARNAIRLRTEPFCIHCGYDLTGLPDGHICPECGMQFHHAVINEYRRDPHWFIKRYNMRQQHPAAEAFAAGPVRSPRANDGT
jgi:hypothetical protein